MPLEEVKQDVWDLKKAEDTYSIYSRTYKVKGITIGEKEWREKEYYIQNYQ